MKEALEILRSLPAKVKDVSRNPSDTTVYFSDYTDSALVVTFFYYIVKQGDVLKATSDMNLEILNSSLRRARFAFPRARCLRSGRRRIPEYEFINLILWKHRRIIPTPYSRRHTTNILPITEPSGADVYPAGLRFQALGAHGRQSPCESLCRGRRWGAAGAAGDGTLRRRDLARRG